LVSEYSGHLSVAIRRSATSIAFAASSGLFILIHATVSCTQGQQLPNKKQSSKIT
jgi:hypothetical protein